MTEPTRPLIAPELVRLDADLGPGKRDVITALAGLVAADGRADAEGLARDAWAREESDATGMGDGIAIPHAKSAAVREPSLAFARLAPKVDFGGGDGGADLVFMIAAPDGAAEEHLALLSKLARSLVHPEFLDSLRSASTSQEIVDIVDGAIGTKPAEAAEVAETPAASAEAETGASAAAPAAGAAAGAGAAGPGTASSAPARVRRIVAVTACPTGIAHTFMAADALELAGKRRDDVELHVEPQGSSGYQALDPAVIRDADAVILATDVGVRDRARFAGKPGVESGVKRAVSHADALIDEALAAVDDPRGHRIAGGAEAGSEAESGSSEGRLGWGKRIQQAVMTGVSYMIPFVAAGGLLIALGFALGGYQIANTAKDILANSSLTNLPADGGLAAYLGAICFTIGALGFGFLVPALSGYIAYALAGRPGIAPGFIGGAIAVALGAGFLGGLVTGLLAGLIAMWLAGLKAPRWLSGLMPVVIIPLVTTLIVGLLMYLLLGGPIAAIMTGLTNWLNGMNGASAVLLGAILGLMMCFDLGGPVNKAAYLFGTAGLSAGTEASMHIMAAVMAAGMVPPLALALATAVRPKLFTPVERENGRAAWLLGASFISEGAIPFAAADPLRVIPSMMAGGAVTGALTMVLNVALRAPHGGLFVWFAIDPFWGFLVALAAGVLVSAVLVIVLKSLRPRPAEPAHAVAPAPAAELAASA
ncbi:PTS system fructose-specific EIIABC component [Pseudoclavibacter triregionum]|nr:PTS system fructose-specific EIIABC component [Pseudoclavibacter triregionum]